MVDYKIRYELLADELETIAVETFKPKSKLFLINTRCRPPDLHVRIFKDYEECAEMTSENKEVVLIGVFNCDWTLEKDKISLQTDKLTDLANLFQFE